MAIVILFKFVGIAHFERHTRTIKRRCISPEVRLYLRTEFLPSHRHPDVP